MTMKNIIHILSFEDGHGYKNGLFKKWVCKECNKWSAAFKVNTLEQSCNTFPLFPHSLALLFSHEFNVLYADVSEYRVVLLFDLKCIKMLKIV